MKRILYSAALLLLASAVPTFADEHNGQTNVRNHGAKCDGINDDTSAFRQAINDAPFGGIVFVPAGKCVVSETLVINSTHLVSIVGDGVGSQIFQRADKTLLRLTGVNALMIKNLFLGSAATAPGTALIELNNSHHNRIDNVTMLGSSYGLHLYGSLLNTIVDLRSGINFGNLFFADSKVSTNQYWVYAERNPTTNISANANTFIAPALEGGTNGIALTDTNGQGSLQIVGGTIEGVTGIGLQFQGTFLPSSSHRDRLRGQWSGHRHQQLEQYQAERYKFGVRFFQQHAEAEHRVSDRRHAQCADLRQLDRQHHRRLHHQANCPSEHHVRSGVRRVFKCESHAPSDDNPSQQSDEPVPRTDRDHYRGQRGKLRRGRVSPAPGLAKWPDTGGRSTCKVGD